jgi:hypothetical protein
MEKGIYGEVAQPNEQNLKGWLIPRSWITNPLVADSPIVWHLQNLYWEGSASLSVNTRSQVCAERRLNGTMATLFLVV